MDDNNLRVTDLSDDDKPRERALRLGVSALSNADLMAITLGSGIQGKSVIALSREILADCGNRLDTLAQLSIREVSRKYKGVGPARAVQLMAAIELGRRCARDAAEGGLPTQVTASNDAYDYVKGEMGHLRHEEFRILVLNRANRIKACEVISSGGTAATVVDVKLLVKRAVDALAEGLILVHNHPSGSLRPSAEDDRLTERIRQAAALFDIRVLDHLIVTSAGYFSYADEGRL